MVTSRELGKTHLPLWAAGFVALICVTILGLSTWREWETRDAELKNAEIDVTNLAHSLVQHADDTFELADTIRGFQGLCEGKYDHLPEQAFYMVGTIEAALEEGKKLAAAA